MERVGGIDLMFIKVKGETFSQGSSRVSKSSFKFLCFFFLGEIHITKLII